MKNKSNPILYPKIFLIGILVFILSIAVGCSSNTTIENNKTDKEIASNVSITSGTESNLKNLPISRYEASYAIDLKDINVRMGDADYVFIATVVKENGTEYLHIPPIEDLPSDVPPEQFGSPYTFYTIIVNENIKGELITDTEIEIQKAGGIAYDQSQYFLYENDFLPSVGQTYVFYGYGQPEGELVVSGPYSNAAFNKDSMSSTNGVQPSGQYQALLDAYDSQIITNRERSMSIYDVNYVP